MANLEDLYGDIVNKARRGRKLSEADLGQKVGLGEKQVKELIASKWKPDDATLRKVASELGLGGDRLVAIANNAYSPAPVDLERWGCAAMLPMPYEDMVVNVYLIWDKKTKKAVLFDTGTQFDPIHEVVKKHGLTVELLCLTHTHVDHVVAIEEVLKNFQPAVAGSANEPVGGARFVREGETLKCGNLTIKVHETDGHSAGGLTFVVSGFGGGLPDIAVAGDAIFAGSMGGPMVSYDNLHKNVKGKILTLKDDTVLMCGHGPMTTVGEEKRNNPFFP